MRGVVTVLQYFVIAALIGVVIFLICVLLFGRGEQLAALPARTSPAELPDGAVSGEDIRRIRFAVGARGYRMSDVDWTLERAAGELDRLRSEIVRLGGDPDVLPAHPDQQGLAPVDLTKGSAEVTSHSAELTRDSAGLTGHSAEVSNERADLTRARVELGDYATELRSGDQARDWA